MFAVIFNQCCVITCMNCGLNVLFVESWGRTHLHIHHHLHLHLDCPGCPLNHIQLCFLMAVARAKHSNSKEQRQKKQQLMNLK